MNKKGFTLIELLVVIVILAIIALITVPNALAMISTAQTRANERSAESFWRAAEVYCLEMRTVSPTAAVPHTSTAMTTNPAAPAIRINMNNTAGIGVFSLTFTTSCGVVAGSTVVVNGTTFTR